MVTVCMRSLTVYRHWLPYLTSLQAVVYLVWQGLLRPLTDALESVDVTVTVLDPKKHACSDGCHMPNLNQHQKCSCSSS